ncbi:hypothetical protein BAE44_0023484 [Dichanthelium oligosanthes]|uniref:Uncharacterized protein n=1 Tax=Dichanthelium oligosanthes TaxID=888268 RepID=A0A1E5URI9_9POAL|nr:hypothetical protein BAE44_0023484 [Dichanthelium oligosanthes]
MWKHGEQNSKSMEISFKTKDKYVIKRAWKLSKTILFYCLDHEIDKATRTARRNPIKFPAMPEGSETKELANSTGRVTGNRKNNTDQSTKSIESSNMLCREESEQPHSVAVKNTSPQVVLEAQCATKRLKGDPQFEQSMDGASASQNGAETVSVHENRFGISSPYASGENLPVDKDVELDNVICEIIEAKDGNGRGKAQEEYTGKQRGAHMDSHKSQKQNDVSANLYVENQADGSQLESGKERDMEWQESAYGFESISGQEKGTSMRDNSISDRGMIPRDDSNKSDNRNGKIALDHVDHSAVKQVHAANVDKVATTRKVTSQEREEIL